MGSIDNLMNVAIRLLLKYLFDVQVVTINISFKQAVRLTVERIKFGKRAIRNLKSLIYPKLSLKFISSQNFFEQYVLNFKF